MATEVGEHIKRNKNREREANRCGASIAGDNDNDANIDTLINFLRDEFVLKDYPRTVLRLKLSG